MDPRLPDWLDDPALGHCFARLRERLERNGLRAEGRVRVEVPSREERHAMSAMLGRTVTRDAVSIDLAELDARLRERSGCGGLVEVLAIRAGGPLRDRPAERDARRTRREEPLALARRLVGEPWVETWVSELRRTGLLSRAADPQTVVRQAVSVVRALLDGAAPGSRVELAAHVVGDAHALDEDRVLTRVVARGLAAARGAQAPGTGAQRWTLWESFGVGPDAVSSTCLLLGLVGEGRTPAAERLRNAAVAGDPVHLTRWDLRRIERFASPGRPVLVCENPRVLEAVAETYSGEIPVVCTAGEPNTVVASTLELLASAGARLHYHGDFDWPGIAIANRAVDRFGVTPWLMRAVHYERGVRNDAPELLGRAVEPSWDPELGAAMRRAGRSLHQETVLPRLLEALQI